MANSKYEYVREFERDEILLLNTWIVVRVDGRGFHKLSTYYHLAKPNDRRALDLMNAAAKAVVNSVQDVCFAYGISDEFSFVFHRNTNLFERRAAKLVSTIVSTFTAFYVHLWDSIFGDEVRLDGTWLPTFDGRAVCYPSTANLRDYLSWRQVDCHINNLYNTTFWAMVLKGGMSTTDAEEELKGTVAADKNEILFSRFKINYNNEPEMFKKGSVVFKEYALEKDTIGRLGTDDDEGMYTVDTNIFWSKTQTQRARKARAKAKVVVEHVDIIKDEFWSQRPWILSGRPGKPVLDIEKR